MGFYTYGTKIPLGRFTAHAYRHIQFTKSRPCNSPLGENPAEYTVHFVHQNSSPQRGNGPLTRYAKLRVAHVPGMLGTFSPPPTSKAIASRRSRHATRHVRTLVPWCMPESLTRGGGENVPGIPGACANRNVFVSGKRPMRSRERFPPYQVTVIRSYTARLW